MADTKQYPSLLADEIIMLRDYICELEDQVRILKAEIVLKDEEITDLSMRL